jgi:hypothetical protein
MSVTELSSSIIVTKVTQPIQLATQAEVSFTQGQLEC